MLTSTTTPISTHPTGRPRIATNIITGFLGVGKTTAIRHLLAQKPQAERWSVLVNEFGEIGIDGALLKDTNAQIREVPGGCICCVADLPMKIALNMLISKTQPDRILIEPTGLGHPADIINSLTGENYQDIIDLRATLTLVDARKIKDSRYFEHAIFQDQLAVADVLVANKQDLASADDIINFHHLLSQFTPQKQAFGIVNHGQLDLAWLDLARHPASYTHPQLHHTPARLAAKKDIYNTKICIPEGQTFLRKEGASDGFYSCGWLFVPEKMFDFNHLFGWITGLDALRVKAVMKTHQGIYMFNAENGVLSVNPATLTEEDLLDSRIEIIDNKPIAATSYEAELLKLIT